MPSGHSSGRASTGVAWKEATGRQWEFLDAGQDLGLLAFDVLRDVFLFVKDRDRRFVYFDRGFPSLMSLTAGEILGRRDEDLSPKHLADHYRADDERVMNSGLPLVDIIELVHNVDGAYEWFTTTKFPVVRNGTTIGVAGIIRSLTRGHTRAEELRLLEPAIRLISEHYSRAPSVTDLAASVAMSPTHFTRVFKARIGTTPHRYLRHVRLTAACKLLSNTDLSIGEVAMRTGFYDHSHLTNEMARGMGVTPRQYRLRASRQAVDSYGAAAAERADR